MAQKKKEDRTGFATSHFCTVEAFPARWAYWRRLLASCRTDVAVSGFVRKCRRFLWDYSSVLCDSVTGDHEELSACLKLCFLLGITAMESVEMLQQAFKVEVARWTHKCLSGFRASIELTWKDQARSERPSTSQNDKNAEIIDQKIKRGSPFPPK